MSDYYTHFSEAIKLKNPKEKKWLEKLLKAGDGIVGPHWDVSEDGPPKPLTDEAKFWEKVLGEKTCPCRLLLPS